MSADVALVGTQVRYEQKSYWRNPLAAGFTFLFPLVLFFILVGVTQNQFDKADLGAGVHLAQYLTPSVLGYAVMSACFMSVAMTLVRQRESGILKRMRGTPVPAWAIIGGVIGNAVIVAALLSLVSIVFAVAVYGVSLPAANILPVVVTITLASVTFCALGVAVSTIIPNVDSGPAIVNVPYFLLVFISGTYFPISGTMAHIAAWLPLRPFIVALYYHGAFSPLNSGNAWAWHQLGSLLLWGVGSTVFAIRHFKWTPKRG
jgi:ABC-2 type transport system permease protein